MLSFREAVGYAVARVRGVPTLAMLRRQGLRAGTDVHLGPFCLIDYQHAHLIELGDGCTLAPGVQILAHDASTKRHLGYTRVARVSIGRDAFIGAGSIVMPGVRIGDSAIVGAGSLVIDDIPAAMLAFGRPARVVGPIEDYLEQRRQEISRGPVFDLDWTVYGQLTKERQIEMARQLADGRAAYVP